jgi:DNA-binding SARP family transcriptional activator
LVRDVDSGTESLAVCVLGTFRFRAQGNALPSVLGGSQRLLALLGLRDRPLMRVGLAGTLWPESSEEHSYSSLRSALGRLSRITRDAVVVTPLDVCLADGVAVDIRNSRTLAHRLLDRDTMVSDRDLSADALSALSVDVLPDWYDDWVLVEGEEWRQLRLHALEALADRLLVAGRFGEATGAALAAVRAEPLRESARAAVIRVHLAEGNQSDALAEFARYSTLLRAELDLDPTPRLRELIVDLQRR